MKKLLLQFTGCVFFIASVAQPNPNTVQQIGNVTVWSDYSKPATFYYQPGYLSLAKEKNGQPSLKLILIRYTGNTINKDLDQNRFRSLLQLKVKLNNPSKEELQKVKTTLGAKDLFIMPVSKIQNIIVLPSLDGSDSIASRNGYLEQSQSIANNSYWDERDFTLRLDNYTAQFVKAQLDSNKLVMSLAYAFYVNTTVKIDTGRITGYGLRDLNTYRSFSLLNDSGTAMLVKADAIPIRINVKEWPDIVTKIDINEKLPPSYPCLDIYCYDFNNEIRNNLYSKSIQIKAKGIANDDVMFNVGFNLKTPDVYAASVRFKYAVRIDLPFYYRITEVSLEGEPKQTEWIKRENWYEMIDITSKPVDN